MLFFIKFKVEHKALSSEQLWDMVELESKATLGAIAAGKIVASYKVVGQRRVVTIIEAESHDELDRILMAGLPMAHYLEIEEILPLRPYEGFAKDVARRWK
ncbi:MAG: translational initiation factor [Nitrospirae bacterium]|nr:translational initiation factor [Nitrospirota bacterium]MBF0591155.1 translational initiation factor [Nitrospirota bacterium]